MKPTSRPAARGHRVAPGAVRVWRGYPATGLTLARFLELLGGTFIPGCSLMQPPLGLWAYLPGVPAQANLPAGVPWETALLCWADSAAYGNVSGTVGGRAYTLTHLGVYNLSAGFSSSQFAIAFSGALALETPVYLFDAPIDWMLGSARHLVAGFTGGAMPADYLTALATWAKQVASSPPAGLDGAFLCVGANYVAWWEHWAAKTPGTSPTATLPSGLTNCLWQVAAPTRMSARLNQTWPGLTLTGNPFLNVQFKRRRPANR